MPSALQLCVVASLYPVKGQGLVEVEGEEWVVKVGVLQLPQHTGTEEHWRPVKVDGRARAVLPVQLWEEKGREAGKADTYRDGMCVDCNVPRVPAFLPR